MLFSILRGRDARGSPGSCEKKRSERVMYKQAMQDWKKHLDFTLLDEASLFLSMVLAWLLGIRLGHPFQDPNVLGVGLLALLINLLVIIAFDSLRNVMSRGYLVELTATLRHTLLVMACVLLALLIRNVGSQQVGYVFAVSATLYGCISYITRIAWKKLFRLHFNTKEDKRTLLIVTDSQHAAEIIQRVRNRSFARHKIAGLVLIDRDAKGEEIDGIPVAANLEDAAEFLCQAWVDEVLFFHASLDDRVEALIDACREMALTIHLYVNIHGIEESKQTLGYLAGYEVLTANIRLMRPVDALVKRTMDVLVGLVGSLFALLILLILGPALYVKSPGPLIFKQVRVGENGRKFRMYKIRSMYLDAEERKAALYAQSSHADGMMFKMDFDPRVIGNRVLPDGTQVKGIGDFIRKTSLDEFPQFFNVLKGDMSIVGTRPPTLDEWEKYQFRHRARMSVRPGLTGMWQIQPNKDEMPFEEVVALDTDYIANWSIGEDCRIILATMGIILRTIFRRKGAPQPEPRT